MCVYGNSYKPLLDKHSQRTIFRDSAQVGAGSVQKKKKDGQRESWQWQEKSHNAFINSIHSEMTVKLFFIDDTEAPGLQFQNLGFLVLLCVYVCV